MSNERLRQLPSVDAIAQRFPEAPRAVLIAEIRKALDRARKSQTLPDIEAEVRQALDALSKPSLRRVINATGVVLHTNLGRAPLTPPKPIAGYSNLEYDLATGKRGKRDTHIAPWIERLTGKPGIAVNNNAAAVYLVLNELAAGHEVIVSRGQLVEIGDGFRIPDIMRSAGVTLREVGTTNRTSIDDFRHAIGDRTRLLMIVHPSNFRIEGFTAQPTRQEIAALGREHGIPVYEDLGSGCVLPLFDEPQVRDSLRARINVVSFSADKLLGGPQAGIVAGDAELVTRIRRNPMFRALRLDKLILQSLEETFRLLAFEHYDAIPALRMIRLSAASVKARAEALRIPGAEIIPGESVIGGGSTPRHSLPTWLISLPESLEPKLRAADPPIVGRIEDSRLLLDLRTVFPEDDALINAHLL
ncbi:MAG: L-seryl-tRNA(Sec) selenium transferase [Bryobacterales bacterium]|nr:L-seryl-tRNA(Sec) selenium transferase [Bryobacterales bacterium]